MTDYRKILVRQTMSRRRFWRKNIKYTKKHLSYEAGKRLQESNKIQFSYILEAASNMNMDYPRHIGGNVWEVEKGVFTNTFGIIKIHEAIMNEIDKKQ